MAVAYSLAAQFKSIVLHFGHANPHFCYRLSDTSLSSQQYVRDLKSYCELTYYKHIKLFVVAATIRNSILCQSVLIPKTSQFFGRYLFSSPGLLSNIANVFGLCGLILKSKRGTCISQCYSLLRSAIAGFNLPALRSRRIAFDFDLYYKIIIAKSRLVPADLLTKYNKASLRCHSSI